MRIRELVVLCLFTLSLMVGIFSSKIESFFYNTNLEPVLDHLLGPSYAYKFTINKQGTCAEKFAERIAKTLYHQSLKLFSVQDQSIQSLGETIEQIVFTDILGQNLSIFEQEEYLNSFLKSHNTSGDLEYSIIVDSSPTGGSTNGVLSLDYNIYKDILNQSTDNLKDELYFHVIITKIYKCCESSL